MDWYDFELVSEEPERGLEGRSNEQIFWYLRKWGSHGGIRELGIGNGEYEEESRDIGFKLEALVLVPMHMYLLFSESS